MHSSMNKRSIGHQFFDFLVLTLSPLARSWNITKDASLNGRRETQMTEDRKPLGSMQPSLMAQRHSLQGGIGVTLLMLSQRRARRRTPLVPRKPIQPASCSFNEQVGLCQNQLELILICSQALGNSLITRRLYVYKKKMSHFMLSCWRQSIVSRPRWRPRIFWSPSAFLRLLLAFRPNPSFDGLWRAENSAHQSSVFLWKSQV